MWGTLAEIVGENFEKFFFTFITLVIAGAAILDIRDKNFPPGPMGIPIFGYLPFLNYKAPYLTLAELAQQYGRIFSVNLGSLYTVVVSDIKMLRDTFSADGVNGRPPLFLTHGLVRGKGLLGAEGENWNEQSHFVSSTLREICSGGRGVLEARIQKSVQEFIKDLRNNAGQSSSTQMDQLVRHHVGNTLADVILGMKFDKDDKTWNYMQLVLQQRFQALSLTSSFNYIPWLRRFGKFANIFNTLKDGNEETQKIYKELLEKQQSSSTSSVEPIKSVIQAYAVQLKKPGKSVSFSADNVQHVLSDLMNAGWEPTMTTINWLYLYMALYPQVQDRVLEEIESVVGRKEVTLKSFDRLPYTKAVILEIWRHRVIFPQGVPHSTTQNVWIGDFKIPKGSMVIPNLWAIHHDARLWTNPSEFKPERHLNDDGSLCSTENILPFQTGKRACIGEDLGRQIVQLFFANTVSQLKLSVPKGVSLDDINVPECGLTIAPKSFQLGVQLRK